jgi:SAM-dependent methyltransferase
MRRNIKSLIELVAGSFPIVEPIYEFGALQVEGQEGFSDLRPIFPGKQYVGSDMRPGMGVDKVLDLHDLALPPGVAGTVLCLDTLEHVEYPHRAVAEIHRILEPNGMVVITSVMNFHIHGYPHDYWRFTPEAFKSLLKPFAHCFVGFAGEELFPHTVAGIGWKGAAPDLTSFRAGFARWVKEQEPSPSGFKQAAKLLLPPIVWGSLSRLAQWLKPQPSAPPSR